MSDAPSGGPARRRVAIDPEGLRELLVRVRDILSARREYIDALNVFPVPDGDTGTNLLLTVRTALEESSEDGHAPSALAKAALLGARGNSGVILSQVVRAFAETVASRGQLDAAGLEEALGRARDEAYDAVADPVEGTMLTAIRVAAETAERRAADGAGSLSELVDEVLVAVRGAVSRTTEQLTQLREAGVVDAGALGFQAFCEALVGLVEGEPVPSVDHAPAPVVRRSGPVASREAGSLEFRFEVQYVLSAPRDCAGPLKEDLRQLGDSVVVTAIEDLLTVHVHTNDVGATIEAGLVYGRPSRIEVTSFADQIAERGEAADHADHPPREPLSVPGLACVCVLPGDGLRELVEDLGCAVVPGAGGALPSVAELLNAMADAPGEEIVVLPGHPHVVPTSRQASEVSQAEGGRPIRVVVEADSPPRVIAALAVWDPEGDRDVVLASMASAASGSRTGEVVAAVRDADTPAGQVRAGQMLAVCDGEVVAVRDDPVEALAAAGHACGAADAEILTLIVGADVGPDERAEAARTLDEIAPDAELQIIDGGQRPVRYFVGRE